MTAQDWQQLCDQVRSAERAGEDSPEMGALMKACVRLERLGVLTKTKVNAWGLRSCTENTSRGLPGGYWFTTRGHAAGFSGAYGLSWEPTLFGSFMFFKNGVILRDPVTGC